MNDTLQSLHGTANDALVRLLFERVRGLRSGPSDISQAAKALPGRPFVPANAPGLAGQGGDIGGSESGGVNK